MVNSILWKFNLYVFNIDWVRSKIEIIVELMV